VILTRRQAWRRRPYSREAPHHGDS
jgi:hypothetical protein